MTDLALTLLFLACAGVTLAIAAHIKCLALESGRHRADITPTKESR